MIVNPAGFLLFPHKQWQQVANLNTDQFSPSIIYPMLLALLPSIAWYYGVAEVGWTVGDNEDITRLTHESALRLVLAFYFAMVLSIVAIGYSIHWMAETYGTETSFAKGIAVAGFSATPLFIAGAFGFIPLMWFDLTIGIIAVGWAVYLIYMGIPIVMGIPEERGFLYASAVVGVAMVILMALMGISVILWDLGFMPVFTD